ncbi:MAG: hypothetical protein WCC12_15695, partial [Anaerolineales bacterium]
MKTWLRLMPFVLAMLLISVAASPVPLQAGDSSIPPTQTVKLIFIHHSTGSNWLADGYGNLGQTLGQNNYFVSDTNYGWGSTGIGDSTDIPHWIEWFASSHTPTYMNELFNESGTHSSYTRTLADPGGENQVVMFKSCYPNSALGGNPGDPAGDHAAMTVAGAKYVYNTILDYFGSRPDKMFVVITAPPLRDGTYAANARAFNLWLVNDWLTDYTLNNVFVFDFYNVLTHPNAHHRFTLGAVEHTFTIGQNTLSYPTGDDHPSAAGSQKATDEFVPLLNVFYHRWKQNAPVAQPTLISPSPRYTTDSNPITFDWNSVPGAGRYEIVFADDSGFAQNLDPHTDLMDPTFGLSFVDGRHYWKVRAYNAVGDPGPWSAS